MSLEIAEFCLSASINCGAKQLIIIGGEPTLYPFLFDLINLAHENGMRVSLASNGIAFSNYSFAIELSKAYQEGDSVSVSLKGASELYYKEVSPDGSSNNFEAAANGVRNLADLMPSRHTISYVVSQSNICNLEEALAVFRILTDAPIGLSLCGPFAIRGAISNTLSLKSVCELADHCLDILGNTEYANVNLHVNVPLCKINEGSLVKAASSENVNVTFGCHVLHRSGLVFDTNGDLLLCNHLPGMPVGKMGIDYSSKEGFSSFLESQTYVAPWEALVKLPFVECANCELLASCLGGCPLYHY